MVSQHSPFSSVTAKRPTTEPVPLTKNDKENDVGADPRQARNRYPFARK
ncbi:MAG: hypothetical protein ACUVTH_11285 [Thermogutta sp.]